MSTKTPQETDIDALFEAIKTALKSKFPAATVDDYLRLQEPLSAPTIGLELSAISPDGSGDIGTEQFAAELTFTAYCIVSFVTTNAGKKGKRSAASLACAVAAFAKSKTWGQPVGLPDGFDLAPDVFPSKSGAYEAWRFEWKQSAILGQSVWSTGGPTAQEIEVLGDLPQ